MFSFLRDLAKVGSAGHEKKKETEASHSEGKSKKSVATPMPDRMVSLKDEPSLLSPDFDQERAMTEAKFNAFQKGMKQMEEKKN